MRAGTTKFVVFRRPHRSRPRRFPSRSVLIAPSSCSAAGPDAKENQPPADDRPADKPPLSKVLDPKIVLGEVIKPVDDYSAPQKTQSGHEVFCVRYSPDGQFVAAARGNGNIDVYSATKGTKVYELPAADVNGASPTCCIRFRPNTASSKTRNVLLAVDAAGIVRYLVLSRLLQDPS